MKFHAFSPATFNLWRSLSAAVARSEKVLEREKVGFISGTKSIAVIAKGPRYNINFTGLQLYRDKSELIRIPGLVPLIFVGFC